MFVIQLFIFWFWYLYIFSFCNFSYEVRFNKSKVVIFHHVVHVVCVFFLFFPSWTDDDSCTYETHVDEHVYSLCHHLSVQCVHTRRGVV